MKFWLVGFSDDGHFDEGTAVVCADTQAVALKKLIEQWKEHSVPEEAIQAYIKSVSFQELDASGPGVLFIQY